MPYNIPNVNQQQETNIMPIISMDESRLSEALDTAEDLFWGCVGTNYPEARAGDLSPARAIALSTAMREAVVEWLEFNVDTPPNTATIMLHRIEYYYRGHNALLLTDSDKEQIAYCISEGISEGDLCSTIEVSPVREEEVRGYWKINNNP